MSIRALVAVLVAIAAFLLPGSSSAQSVAGAQSLMIPPDVRAEGMGRVWAPLGTTPYAAWGNVGGLGLAQGVQFVKADAQLVPGLADDVFYDYKALVLGHTLYPGGVALNLSLGINLTDLNYGESVVTDEGSPDPIGTFESYETATGFTFGAGFGDLLGVGLGVKHVFVNLAPSWVADGAGRDETDAVDFGILARSPRLVYDAQAPQGLAFGGEERGHASLRILGGMAWSNRGGDIDLSPGREGDPLPKVRRESLGLELGVMPISRLIEIESPFLRRVFRDADILAVSAGIGREDDLLMPGGEPDSLHAGLSKNEREGIITYDGFEIRLFDIFSYRRGSIYDDPGEIKGKTNGWGLSLFGYVGVDYAEIPQCCELQRVEKWSFWARIPFDW